MKKNKTLILVVGVLLVIVVGVSFAYFLVTTNITGEGSNVNLGTGSMPKVEYDAGDRILSKDNIIPRDIISKNFKVTVTPTKDIKEVTYKIFINITENTFVKCTEDNYDEFSNNCELNAEELIFRLKDNNGNVIKTGDLTGRTGNVEIVRETKTQDIRTEYEYTIEIEFKDTNKDQNHNANKTFNGSINVEFANNYLIVDDIIANTVKGSGTPTFSKTACTSGCEEATVGMYKIEGGMYNGTSHYWRGDTEDNYVKFAGFCWRIVRINGDGTIRLIYDGTTCHANGTSTTESITQMATKYNYPYNQSNYVGWTYTGTSQRTTSGKASIAKKNLELWYSANITGTNASKVEDGKFCNDRSVGSGYTWSISPNSTLLYAGVIRENGTPTLSCPSGDVYTLKVGLITSDEVIYAGGNRANNVSYYLYNGQTYWTMSPVSFGSNHAMVYSVGKILGYFYVDETCVLRPVINLKADTLFKLGTNGTLNNPYEVLD